jgi:medium-chain acyl-[acyl-carrier-protein] hydrolase
MSDLYDEPFEVRSAEISPDGLLHLFRVADIIQEAAGKNADQLGFGMHDIAENGSIWALTRLQLLAHKPISGSQRYRLQTWPAGIQRLWALRRYRIIDEHGDEVLQGISYWMVLDKVSHRPQRIPNHLAERTWIEAPAQLPNWSNLEFELDPDGFATDQIRVRFSDLDINDHVNNAQFLKWGFDHQMELLDPSLYAYEIDIRFEKEAKMADNILAKTQFKPYHEHSKLGITQLFFQNDEQRRIADIYIRWASKA